MIARICKIFFVAAIASSTNLFGQTSVDPDNIIDSVRQKLDGIIDYKADIEIEVEVDFINMPVKHATVYYKSPDKIRFKSEEFIMLPKRGLGNRVTSVLEEPYTAIYLQEEILNEVPHHVIRIVPMGKNPDIILATWWVNSKTYLLARNENITRNEGSFIVDFNYGDPHITLPTEMVFYFEIEKLNLPLKFIGKSSGMELDKTKMEEVNNGKVYIRFSNYTINSSLPDELFIEDDGQ